MRLDEAVLLIHKRPAEDQNLRLVGNHVGEEVLQRFVVLKFLKIKMFERERSLMSRSDKTLFED